MIAEMEAYGDSVRFAASAGTPYAARAAAEIYDSGGNAADAAVAAAAAVSVTEPLLSSLGGGGFALVRSARGAELIDYYDVMPGKGLPESAFGGNPPVINLKYGPGIESTVGAASCAVPGALRGWEALLGRHGRLSFRETLAPAVRLAREGFRVASITGAWFQVAEEVLRLTEETKKNFYNGGRVYREGEELRFPELADTLEAIGEEGAGLFYHGELARRISECVLGMGGIITERDLAEYEPVVREPFSFSYDRSRVHTNGPPSAGGPTLAQMMKILSGYDLASLPEEEYVRLVSGAMRLALADRESEYTDGAQNFRVAERLAGEEYVRGQRARIFGSPHTTHLSCIDSDGLAVSITASMGYGSGIVIPGTGVPMGNTLGEPELNPRGFHALEPGERLISSMSPTVVESEGGGISVLGSPGASRIPTAIMQTLIGVLEFGMGMEPAVNSPRFHSEDGMFAYEAGAPSAGKESFSQVLAYEEPSMYFGGVNAVRLTPEGTFEAAADPRRSGGVAFA
jgi:gamma-glutamyltranspeptidase/glutathione hydrolase